MDPSEFEDTVERRETALGAGALERLLEAPQQPKFTIVDLSKESDDIYLAVYALQESAKKFEEFSVDDLMGQMDVQEEELSKRKEEYSERRRHLSSLVRSFVSTYIEPTSDDDSVSESDRKSGEGKRERNVRVVNGDQIGTVLEKSKELIDTFKREFDNLSALSRFSESLFLTAYKSIGSLPDPATTIKDALSICLRSQEALKKAQEQMKIAEEILAAHPSSSSSSSTSSVTASFSFHQLTKQQLHQQQEQQQQIVQDLETRLKASEEERMATEERLHRDMASMKIEFDSTIRLKEEAAKNTYERKNLEQQRQFEETIAIKDMEIRSLLRSVNDLNQREIEAMERSRMLDSETAKRREIEEKLRNALMEVSTSNTLVSELNTERDALLRKCLALETVAAEEKAHLVRETEDLRKDFSILRIKLTGAERDLASRPPADLRYLVEQVSALGSHSERSDYFLQAYLQQNQQQQLQQKGAKHTSPSSPSSSNLTSTSTSPLALTAAAVVEWKDVESYIIDCVRQASSAATQSRILEQDRSTQVNKLQEALHECKIALQRKTSLADALELDLAEAHRVIEAGGTVHSNNNNNNSHNKKNSWSKNSYVNNNAKMGRVVDGKGKNSISQGDMHFTISSINTINNNDNNDNKNNSNNNNSQQWDEESGQLFMSSSPLTTTFSGGRRAVTAVTQAEADRSAAEGLTGWGEEEEHRAPFSRKTPVAADNPGGGVGVEERLNPADRLMHAVQQQRDRFMRTARDKETELAAVQGKLERAQDELIQTRNENLELYRRLRILRVTCSSSINNHNNNNYINNYNGGANGGGVAGGERGEWGIGFGEMARSGTRKPVFSTTTAAALIGRGESDRGVDGWAAATDVADGEMGDDDRRWGWSDGGHADAGFAGSRRRGGGGVYGSGRADKLEEKYMALYEEQISPFQVEEMEKNRVLSKLNILERGLAYITHNVLRDTWARNALLIYLCFVHFLALGYVFRVLNPQLIDEVDQSMKEKWSKETMEAVEHPDNYH